MKEDIRVKALKKLNLLDTGSEPIFDEITKIGAMICDVPISLISLVDEARQYFKSNYGLENIRETKREFSFCQRAIVTPESFYEIPDATSSLEYKDNPLVTGYPYIVYYLGVPIKDSDGNALGTLCVIDQKERHLSPHQKECLKLLAKQVERLFELRQDTIHMNSINTRLIHLSERLSEFSSIAAHDLKEPLRMIKSFIQLLEKKNTQLWDQKDLSYLHFISDGAERLEKYVEGLLNYTKSLGSTECYQSFDFAELLNEIITYLTQLYSDKMLTFETDIGDVSSIKLPREAVFSICQNILDNSCKFSPINSVSKVFFSLKEDADTYFFSIIDNGLGIPEKKVQKVTGPFVRLNSRQEFEGLGLGLSIVESQVHHLNGKLTIESELGRGTKVCIEIPKLN